MIQYALSSQDVVHETPLPFFYRQSLESYQNEQRLALESVATGQVTWSIPLRGAIRGNDDGYLGTSHIGHQMYFVNRGVLHAVSPIEKRILWSKSLENHIDGNGQARHDSRPMVSAMVSPAREEMSQSLLLQRTASMGHLAVVQPNYLCLYGRRSLSVLDPRTGDELWKLDGLPNNAQVVGTSDAVFAIVPGKVDALAYRASDGKPIDTSGVAKLLSSTLLTHGPSLLLFEQAGTNPLEVLGIRRAKTMKCLLRLHDPVARHTDWQIELPAGTLVNPLGQEEVIAVQPDGQGFRESMSPLGHVGALEDEFRPTPCRRKRLLTVPREVSLGR